MARRDAHNSDAEFASVVSNMATDPKSYHTTQEQAFRLLCLNHTLLSYISALGAHREKIENTQILSILNDTVCFVESSLAGDNSVIEKSDNLAQSLIQRIDHFSVHDNDKALLIMEQTRLLLELLPEISSLIQSIKSQQS